MPFMIAFACCSLLTSFLLTPFCRDFFAFLGVVDLPDKIRKGHARPTPRVGGVSLAISYLAGVGLLLIAWQKNWIDFDDSSIRLLLRTLPATALIFAVGLIDDIRGISPRKKLAGQTAAAVLAVSMGATIATPDWYGGPRILLDIPAVFWLVLCANAFNLIDGLDGLAAGVALIGSFSLLSVAILHGQFSLAAVILPLTGALIGFLYYNFNPASIFMGDSGSLLVGFLLGTYGLMWSTHAKSDLGRLAPVAALALPLLEVAISVLRRLIRRDPVFGSDRNHIHHKVQTLGMSQAKAAVTLYAASAIAALLAILITTEGVIAAVGGLCVFAVLIYLGVRALGYVEFGTLGKFLLAGAFRRGLRTQVCLREYDSALTAANTIEQCWNALKGTCCALQFSYVSLRVGALQFEETFSSPDSEAGRLKVDLTDGSAASFGYETSVSDSAAVILPMAHRLRERLRTLEFHSVSVGPVPVPKKLIVRPQRAATAR
jgi:UDP-GlcNAc:undecaprenyl-phosphate GlcNAc-1-phosphate transferase